MSDDDLTVLAVKPPPDDEISKIPIHPNLPDINTGAMVLLISPVKTGKSTLVSNLLLNPAFYGPEAATRASSTSCTLLATRSTTT
jgi:hypothetical protein